MARGCAVRGPTYGYCYWLLPRPSVLFSCTHFLGVMHSIQRAEDLNVLHHGVPLLREQVVGASAALSHR
eukprot:6210647-Pleurochrysis_carterae.AAC.1